MEAIDNNDKSLVLLSSLLNTTLFLPNGITAFLICPIYIDNIATALYSIFVMENITKYEDCIVKIENIDNIFVLAERLHTHVFRGQGQDWRIKSRLVRVLEKLGVDVFNYKNREHNIISEFKSRIELYRDFNVNTKDYVECCSLIQHYGGPTRLIDFTDSFFVALFFAVGDIESDRDAIVWGFDEVSLRDIHFKEKPLKSSFGNRRRAQEEGLVDIANKVFEIEEEKDTGLLLIRPNRKNERLSRQQGLFLMQKNIKVSFMDNLKEGFLEYFKENAKNLTIPELNEIHFCVSIIKIIIPAHLKSYIRTELLRMNINHETLFPGIEGFCKSLVYKGGFESP